MINSKPLFAIVSSVGVLLSVAIVFRGLLEESAVEQKAARRTKETAANPKAPGAVATATPWEDPVKQAQQAGNSSPKKRNGKKLVLDPAARAALKGVGADAEAERYWLGAINNPLLPPEERKDLIEDLNEDGLSDPKKPGPADLPLIATRIRLLEQLMPEALDQVNAAAFQEAHKDLMKMYARLSAP